MVFRLLTFTLFLLCYFGGWAQDQVHLQTGKMIAGKVKEIDIDSISMTIQEGKNTTENLKIPKYKIAYIEFENGEQQFMSPDIIRLTNEKVILAKVMEVKEDKIEYLNAQVESSEPETIAKEKVLNVQYGKTGDIEGFYDQILLTNGKTILGVVQEVDVDAIFYLESADTKKNSQIALSEVEEIIFKNGHKQVFAKTDSIEQENNKQWWKFW